MLHLQSQLYTHDPSNEQIEIRPLDTLSDILILLGVRSKELQNGTRRRYSISLSMHFYVVIDGDLA